MEANTFAILRYSNGKIDIRGPIQGDVEEKVNNVFSHYLRSDKLKDAPSIELVLSFARTKEEFIKENEGLEIEDI